MAASIRHDAARSQAAILLIACLLTFSSGCAAITNPTANGIPARLVPPELLADSKENLVKVPLHHLQRTPPESYTLAAGDILAVYVDSIISEEGRVPPINYPEAGSDLRPSVGYPVPVLDDGTLPLPLVDPLPVKDLTIQEARDAILKSYHDRDLIHVDAQAVLVTLLQPRQIRVLVIREDSPDSNNATQRVIRPLRGLTGNQVNAANRRGTGDVIELPAYQNDLLTALARTGGLPGTDAMNEVIIARAGMKMAKTVHGVANPGETSLRHSEMGGQEIRIPLRLRGGESIPFRPEDVVLHEGDIVYVNARPDESFYTGGLLPAIQVPLPRDEDVDVLEAISLIGGPLLNGGINSNNFNGSLVSAGIGNPSPKLLTILRRTPGGQQVPIRVDLERALTDARERLLVQEGDFLLLQETPSQATARYFTNAFQLNFLGTIFRRGDASGFGTVIVP